MQRIPRPLRRVLKKSGGNLGGGGLPGGRPLGSSGDPAGVGATRGGSIGIEALSGMGREQTRRRSRAPSAHRTGRSRQRGCGKISQLPAPRKREPRTHHDPRSPPSPARCPSTEAGVGSKPLRKRHLWGSRVGANAWRSDATKGPSRHRAWIRPAPARDQGPTTSIPEAYAPRSAPGAQPAKRRDDRPAAPISAAFATQTPPRGETAKRHDDRPATRTSAVFETKSALRGRVAKRHDGQPATPISAAFAT